MRDLSAYIEGIYQAAQMELEVEGWQLCSGISNGPGWYFITTTAPLELLQRQALWCSTYITKREGVVKPIKNYNIQARASRYSTDLMDFWSASAVYSGYASNLRERAREHTFPDPGTGGLALSKYPDLLGYEWIFYFATLSGFRGDVSCSKMLLLLGEQMWRSKYGWPVLCAE